MGGGPAARSKELNMRTHILAGLICALPLPSFAETAPTPLGMAGLLTASNKERLPPLTLAAGAALSDAPWSLNSGTYYRFSIKADGSQELGLVGPEFFRAIWIDEVVVEGLEIRPLGLDSVEFDDAGEMEISFIAIKPGHYFLMVPSTSGDLQRLEITIK